MAHPSNPGGVRFGGGAVTLGVALLCLLTTLAIAPAAAEPTPAPAGAAATPVGNPSDPASPTPTPAAPSTTYDLQHSDFSIMISPARLVVNADDAGTTQTISVINRGRSPVPVTVQKRNFTASRDGSLQYDKDSPYGAASWVRVAPSSFVLPPGATQVVSAAISTPDKVEAGDHQVALVFLVPATTGKGNIKVNRGLAAPLYISGPGAVDDRVVLTGLTAVGFSTWGPVTLTATLQNQGTVHRDFRGATALHVRSAGSSAVFPDFTVLRGATRDVAAQWRPPLLCICHPRVTFLNTDGAAQSLSVRVIVFPWPIAAGVLLVGLTVLLVRRTRRHRRRVTRVVGARALVEDG